MSRLMRNSENILMMLFLEEVVQTPEVPRGPDGCGGDGGDG